MPNSSNNITSSSGRTALKLSTNRGGSLSSGLGGEQNAFRHALWSATMTKEFGSNRATEFANAHEGFSVHADVQVDMTQEFQGNNMDLADSTVDILNNEIGRSIVENNPDLSGTALTGAILSEFKENGLFVVNVGDDGALSITRQQISEEQYNQANSILEKLDEHGRDKK